MSRSVSATRRDPIGLALAADPVRAHVSAMPRDCHIGIVRGSQEKQRAASRSMPPRRSAALALTAVLFAILAAPLSAQSSAKSSMVAGHQARPQGRIITTLPYPYGVYVVPVERDDRTPRQRCWDDESARIGGTLSDLDRRSIDLKCSQR